MSFREKTGIALGSALLATGLFTTLQPPSSTSQDQRDAHQQQRQVEQLSDSQEREHQRIEEVGKSAGQAEYERRFIPVEPRPVEPRFRLVPR